MPRRHPKPDESRSPNVAAQKARREKRARRRKAKSPSRGRGFLTPEERFMIEDAIRVEVRRQKKGAADADAKLRNLRTELRADDEAAKRKRSAAA